ncbi:hypothetical protein Fcan01_22036 [Folsomia candida]|uniref:Uncharacterized protein n=1 Tax=Folsomia candida TaxID=158441 RepID=A0A226DCL7_FOLCA|nr:hypothetical protein Fcan01_22036 [Folsomia candida]
MEVQNVEKIGKFNTVMYVFMAVTVGMMVANYWPILGGLGGQVSFKSTPVEQRLYAMLNFFAWSIYLLLIALVVLAGIIAWKMFDAEEAKEKKILAGRLEADRRDSGISAGRSADPCIGTECIASLEEILAELKSTHDHVSVKALYSGWSFRLKKFIISNYITLCLKKLSLFIQVVLKFNNLSPPSCDERHATPLKRHVETSPPENREVFILEPEEAYGKNRFRPGCTAPQCFTKLRM